jgi:hypothetical protein
MKPKILLILAVLSLSLIVLSACATEEEATATPTEEGVTIESTTGTEDPAENNADEEEAINEEPRVTTPIDQAQTAAEAAFAEGYQVYIYDPWPTSVSKAAIQNTGYEFSYIAAAGFTDFSGIWTVVSYVDADGNSEIKTGVDSQNGETDAATHSGFFTFNLFMTAIYEQMTDQSLMDEGIEIQHVEPAYITVVLLNLNNGAQVSNILQIEVN